MSTRLPENTSVARTVRQYQSRAMADRRRRIVERAHAILGEGGTQSLTIERLSREAQVAPRTIYRLFGDKEGVILATVTDRLREVRAHIASKRREYSIQVVFDELDWMVSEMNRDSKYARVVIGFFFASEPRIAAIRELRSVAYNRLRNWMEREKANGRCVTGLDLERIAQEHVASEFYVYHRWAVGAVDDDHCRLELQCAFLKTAILVTTDPARNEYVSLFADRQRRLGAALADDFAMVDEDPLAVGSA